MKRLLILLLIVLPTICAAQEPVEVNTKDVDGTRHIVSKEHWFRNGFTDTHPFGLSVGALVTPTGDIHYSLYLKFYVHEFSKGSVLLLKTKNDAVIWLTQSSSDTHYYYRGLVADMAVGVYPIEHEQLADLYKFGLKKLRVEVPGEYIDIEWNEKRVKSYSSEIATMCDAVLRTTASDFRIDDGF